MLDKRKCLLAVALLLALGMVHFWTMRPGHDWGDDFSMYILHAKNLAEGVPYSQTGYIYNPAYATIGPQTYPPVCPLLLAPVYALCGLNFEAMKLVMLASLAFFLLFVFLSLRKELPFGYTLTIVALVGLNRCFLGDVNSITSDLPFVAILYLTIFIIQKAYDTAADAAPRRGYVLLAAVLICLSYGTRTLGIALLPSLLLYDLLRYRRITGSAVLVGVAFVVAAVAQSLLLHSDVSYFDQYNVGPGVFLHNATDYARQFGGFWHNGYSKPLGGLLFVVVTAFAALGYVSSVRRRITFFEIFPIVYVSAVLLFPGYAGRRYLQPIFPLYLLFAARGLQDAWLARRPALHRATVAAMLAAVAASYAACYTTMRFDLTEGIAKPESAALFDYIVRQTGDDDVIVFIKPRAMALMTARRASVYHMPEKDSELWDYFTRIGATHLVVVENDDGFVDLEDPARLQYLRDFARRNGARLASVFANADFRVYRIAGRDAAADVGAGGK